MVDSEEPDVDEIMVVKTLITTTINHRTAAAGINRVPVIKLLLAEDVTRLVAAVKELTNPAAITTVIQQLVIQTHIR